MIIRTSLAEDGQVLVDVDDDLVVLGIVGAGAAATVLTLSPEESVRVVRALTNAIQETSA